VRSGSWIASIRRARGELQLQLAALAASRLLDCRVLARVEASAAGVDLALDGEGEAEDYNIGRDRRRAAKSSVALSKRVRELSLGLFRLAETKGRRLLGGRREPATRRRCERLASQRRAKSVS
jgi:hypothetical protein